MFNIDLSKNSKLVTRCNVTLDILSEKVYTFSKAVDRINSFLREKRKELKAKQKDRLFDTMDKLDEKVKELTNSIIKVQKYRSTISTVVDGMLKMNSRMGDTRTYKEIGDKIEVETNKIEAYKKAVTKRFLQEEYNALADLDAADLDDITKLNIERCAVWHHIHQSGCNPTERNKVVKMVMLPYCEKLGISWTQEDFPGCDLELF